MWTSVVNKVLINLLDTVLRNKDKPLPRHKVPALMDLIL